MLCGYLRIKKFIICCRAFVIFAICIFLFLLQLICEKFTTSEFGTISTVRFKRSLVLLKTGPPSLKTTAWEAIGRLSKFLNGSVTTVNQTTIEGKQKASACLVAI